LALALLLGVVVAVLSIPVEAFETVVFRMNSNKAVVDNVYVIF